jgi:hypothetical protein
MKRYKDCSLLCTDGQQPIELLDLIEQVSTEKGYKIERFKTEQKNDSLSVYIQKEALPYSRLILFVNNGGRAVDIINIIPMPQSGVSHIECEDYNKLLDIYCGDVFALIEQQYGNGIQQNTEDYTIQDVIPQSYPFLNRWLKGYPLSGHPNDMERWYDFVIGLHSSGEYLSLSNFEKYIEESCGWDKETIDNLSLQLESQLELLNYYDDHRLR